MADPFDSKAFVDKTGANKGTMGEMMDRSQEMSEKRKQQEGGRDSVFEKNEEKRESNLEKRRRKHAINDLRAARAKAKNQPKRKTRKKLRIAVIGAGGRALMAHYPA